MFRLQDWKGLLAQSRKKYRVDKFVIYILFSSGIQFFLKKIQMEYMSCFRYGWLSANIPICRKMKHGMMKAMMIIEIKWDMDVL